MLKTNEDKLVKYTLECKPGHPFASNSIQVDSAGNPFQLPGIGGITLNIQVGDTVYDWAGGHHGGSEHIIIEFDSETKEKLSYEDSIRVTGLGMGLELPDFPEIRLANLDPSLLHKMGIKISDETGKLIVPVASKVPSECMGSGIGSTNISSGA